MKKIIALSALCVFGILSANTLENDNVPTNSNAIEQLDANVTAFRATKTSGSGPSDAYFNTSACRATFLATHTNYVANGKAVVDELLVFVCI